MPSKLKTTQLAEWRSKQLAATSGRCELCGAVCSSPCADHDHMTGQMRGTICRSCNSGLGQIERSVKRYGIKDLSAFLTGSTRYLQRHAIPKHDTLHPTFKSEDDKRVARNATARKRRLLTKG